MGVVVVATVEVLMGAIVDLLMVWVCVRTCVLCHQSDKAYRVINARDGGVRFNHSQAVRARSAGLVCDVPKGFVVCVIWSVSLDDNTPHM